MRFKQYINEAKWQRRQLRKGKPFWVYDKYEISKQSDGTFKLVDISQTIGNEYKEVGSFDSLKKAKDSVSESINEMADEMKLASGHVITKRALERLKKQVNSPDEFVERIQKRATLTTSEIGRLKRTYNSL